MSAAAIATQPTPWTMYSGRCEDGLRELPDSSADSSVSDPPYGLSEPPDPTAVLQAWLAGRDYHHPKPGFMGREWDSFVPGPNMWREVLRVLKPGGHLVAFCGGRTQDWLMLALRLAGFEIRDVGQWCYWTGFPKSLDVSKSLDGAAGAVRARRLVPSKVGNSVRLGQGTQGVTYGDSHGGFTDLSLPVSPLARAFAGFGTALKPAVEPWILCRKPLDGTVAANVARWGTGGLNIDACRFAPGDPMWPGPSEGEPQTNSRSEEIGHSQIVYGRMGGQATHQTAGQELGRWPANLVHVAKASTREREAGCESIPSVTGAEAVDREEGSAGMDNPRAGAGRTARTVRNNHPTLKPIRLMAWLDRLVTPPGGLILDPFGGSGTGGCAAVPQGFRYWYAEVDPSGRFQAIAEARIRWWVANGLGALDDIPKPAGTPATQMGLFGVRS